MGFIKLCVFCLIVGICIYIIGKYFRAPRITTIQQALLYHHGGKLSDRAVVPDAKKAIHFYRLAIKECDDSQERYNYLLEIAKINAYGIHNYNPNLETAKYICNQILKDQYSSQINKDDALEIINNISTRIADDPEPEPEPAEPEPEIITDDLPDLQNQDREEPRDLPDRNAQIRTEFGRYGINVNDIFGNPEYELDVLGLTIGDINRQIQEMRRFNETRNGENGNGNGNARRVGLHIGADSQNVHDSCVTSTIKNSMAKLINTTTSNISPPQAYTEINELIANCGDPEKRDKAQRALNNIYSTPANFSDSGMTLPECLCVVWNRIADYKAHGDNYKHNISRESLVNELADCVEHGSVVCGQGKFARIFDTLNTIDPDVKIIPKGVINTEIMNKMSKIKDDEYQKLTVKEKEAVDADTTKATPEQIAINEKYETDVKQKIRGSLCSDYVNQKIMSQQELDKIVEPYLLGIF